jgi:BirA family transcriptional regulator, biotin operon repressor / biotin---[acetyl-CoA-carboxylase] ligase
VLASLVLHGSGERTALLPLVAAVAVCEACERVGGANCAIKWPNDVWVDGRKVAGILLEGRPQEGWAVLGIGINVVTAPAELPDELRETATSLRAAAGGHDPPAIEAVLDELLRGLEARLDDEPATIVAAWRARDALRDRPVRWEGGEGVARGIAASGALVVETDAGTRELHAGEVSLVRPAEALDG